MADMYRGHRIVYTSDGVWVWEDTGDKVSTSHRPCGRCGRYSTQEGHDQCLGTLIGVMNACCGHGDDTQAYVQFLDGKCVRGKDALMLVRVLKYVQGRAK